MPAKAGSIKVIVTGDLAVDYLVIREQNRAPHMSVWTGSDVIYSRIAFGGSALIAHILLIASRGRSIQIISPPNTHKAIIEPNAKGKANQLRFISVLTNFDLPLMFYVFSPDKATSDGSLTSDQVWRCTEYLGVSHRAKFDQSQYSVPIADCITMGCDVLMVNDANLGYRRHGSDLAKLSLIDWKNCKLPWIVVKLKDHAHERGIDDKNIIEGIYENLPEDVALHLQEKLILVIAANELRNSGIPISRFVSWERTVQDTVYRLWRNRKDGRNLPPWYANYVVVTYEDNGVLLIELTDDVMAKATLFFSEDLIEGSLSTRYPGFMPGYDTCIVSSIVHSISMHLEDGNNDVEAFGQALREGIKQGLSAARRAHIHGLERSTVAVVRGIKRRGNSDDPPSFTIGEMMHRDVSLQYPYHIVASAILNPEDPNYKSIGEVDIPPNLVGNIEEKLRSPIVDNSDTYFDMTWWSFLDHNMEVMSNQIAAPLVQITDRLLKSRDRESLDESDEGFTWAFRIAVCVLLYGEDALRKGFELDPKKDRTQPFSIPIGRFGEILTAGRREIEGYRNLSSAITNYNDQKNLSRPFNVAVLGPPGAGKSFAVRTVVADATNRTDLRIKDLTFNLSQFGDPSFLYSALHQVRDASLEGKLPLVFWDEFDTSLGNEDFGWLPYFLAPMQDGRFFSESVTHPIGRAIFVFAGSRLKSAGELHSLSNLEEEGMSSPDTRAPKFAEKWFANKGRDFQSRLHAVLDIESINKPSPKHVTEVTDPYNYLIRRSLFIRTTLQRNYPRLFDLNGMIRMEEAIIRALLLTDEFRHGARSLETIILNSMLYDKTKFEVSCLPPESQLQLHVSVASFEKYYRRP